MPGNYMFLRGHLTGHSQMLRLKSSPFFAPKLLNDDCKNNPTFKLMQFLHSNLFLVFFSLSLYLPSALPKQRDTKKDVRSNHLCKHKEHAATLH